MSDPLVRFLSRPRITVILLVLFLGGSLCFHAAGKPPVTEERTASETARLALLHGLIEQRARLTRPGDTTDLRRCDARIRSHPAPPDGSAAALARRLVGAWRSSRRDHLYRADGSWTMLPAERGTPHGRWRIIGNQLVVTSGYRAPRSTEKYTIMVIGDEDLVFADQETVFFEKRLLPPGSKRKSSAAANR